MKNEYRDCPLYDRNISEEDCFYMNIHVLDGVLSDIPEYASFEHIDKNESVCLECKYCQQPASQKHIDTLTARMGATIKK